MTRIDLRSALDHAVVVVGKTAAVQPNIAGPGESPRGGREGRSPSVAQLGPFSAQVFAIARTPSSCVSLLPPKGPVGSRS